MSTLELVLVHAVLVHKPVPAVPVHTIHGGYRAVLVHCAAILNTGRMPGTGRDGTGWGGLVL